MSRRAWAGALAGLALASAVAAVVVAATLFPRSSLNRDDTVYVAMAELLQDGRATLPIEDAPFRPWASGVVDDRVVLKYTPPWPAVLAVGDAATGTPRAALAAVAAAGVALVGLLALELTGDRRVALVAAALFGLSPMVLVLSGTTLPYLFQVVLGVAAALLVLSGLRLDSRARLAGAGALLAVAAFARPYDAVLTAVPLGALLLATRRRALVPAVLGGLPVVVLALAYNAAVMGSPLSLPFTVTGEKDAFGFGERGVFDVDTVEFDVADAVSGTWRSLRWLPAWTAGGVVTLALAAAGVWLARRLGLRAWALAAPLLLVPVGYFAFWGPWAMTHNWEGVQTFGPYYHSGMLVPLAIFGAVGLVRLAARARAAPTVLVVLIMSALTVWSGSSAWSENRGVADRYEANEATIEEAGLGRALLLSPMRGIQGFLDDAPFLVNDPDLDQPLLVAEQRGGLDLALLDAHPDRRAARLERQGPGVRVVPLERRSAPAFDVTLRARAPRPGVLEVRDGDRVLARRSLPRGRHLVTWRLAAPAAAPRGRAGDEVVVPVGPEHGELRFVLRIGSREWERRVAYRLRDDGQELELLLPGAGFRRDEGGEWVSATVDDELDEVEVVEVEVGGPRG